MSTRRAPVSLSLVGGNRREPSDAELTLGLVGGETWAITATWQRFAPMVLVLGERSLGSRSEAEDLAQEVFDGVFRKAKKLREPEKLRSFVYSFAIRALKSELRRRKMRSWLSFDSPDALLDLGSGTLDVESRDLLRRFYTLLDRLSPRDRLAFTLRYLESMTLEEVAQSLGTSLSTVKRSVKHASQRLSHWIDSDAELSQLFAERRWER